MKHQFSHLYIGEVCTINTNDKIQCQNCKYYSIVPVFYNAIFKGLYPSGEQFVYFILDGSINCLQCHEPFIEYREIVKSIA